MVKFKEKLALAPVIKFGKKVVAIKTLGSIYDRNCVELEFDDHSSCLIDVYEFLKILKNYEIKITSSRTRNHGEIII